MELFIEISVIMIIASVFGVIMRLLKQPLVVGYIIAGILIGPYGMDMFRSTAYVELFSKIGITILLFIVGLYLSPKIIKEVGKVSLVTGIGQILFTSLIGYAIAILLGIDHVSALYIAITLTFSSTIIIMKLLSDRGDLEKLYGKISIGFLIVQDIFASVILLFISAFADTKGISFFLLSCIVLAKLCVMFLSLYLVNRYVILRLMKYVSRSQELLFLFSLSWGLGLASIFHLLGFSAEIGALVAGVILSVTPYAYEIASRLKPLRDFFIVVFFIFLGSEIVFDQTISLLFPTLSLSLFVLIGNPIIVIILMNLLGFKKRTGFMAGLTVAQISEFSLILASIGFNYGHIPKSVLSLITMVGLITIAGSAYFIQYADQIYLRVEKLLNFLQIFKRRTNQDEIKNDEYDVFLFGYDRVGDDFVSAFKRLELSCVVVDYNPLSIKRLLKNDIPYRYGDAEDIEFLSELPLEKAKLILSTIPDHRTNILLAKYLKNIRSRAIVIAVSPTVHQASDLYKEGLTYVIMPHYLGARYAVRMISRFKLNKNEYVNEQLTHVEYINRRINKINYESHTR